MHENDAETLYRVLKLDGAIALDECSLDGPLSEWTAAQFKAAADALICQGKAVAKQGLGEARGRRGVLCRLDSPPAVLPTASNVTIEPRRIMGRRKVGG